MTKEAHDRHRSKEYEADLIDAFVSTFISRRDCYPIQKSDGSYRSIANPLLPQMLSAHLDGLITLGAYALDRRSHARWLCVDADDNETWSRVSAMARSVGDDGFPAYRETSRRGGHLWFFLEYSISSEKARRFARELLRQHEIDGVEIYPKQDRLLTGPGSLMRLPLGVHRVTGQRYPFIDSEGKPIAPTVREQLGVLTTPERVPIAVVEQVVKDAPRAEIARPSKAFDTMTSASIGETPSERIKNQISVRDFVGRYVDLDAAGRGLCPFHNDHVNSFGVNTEHNFWHCFAGCGGGSIIDFWMRWRRLNDQDDGFTPTVKDLAKMLLE